MEKEGGTKDIESDTISHKKNAILSCQNRRFFCNGGVGLSKWIP